MTFQVEVEKATPACSAQCKNLQIDIYETGYAVDSIEDTLKARRIYCVNADYCRRLYMALEKMKGMDTE